MKPNLLLLTGLLCDKQIWQHQIAALEKSATIHVPDMGQQNHVHDLARRILTEAPEQFALAGFSLGGVVAMEMVRQAPQRITKLALICTAYGPAKPIVQERFLRGITGIQSSDDFFEPYIQDNTQVYFTHVTDQTKQAQFAKDYVPMARRIGPAAGLTQLQALTSIPEEPFPRITCPTLIVNGDLDQGNSDPAAAEFLQQQIPQATLVTINNSAHFAPWEQPEAVTQAMLDWWEIRS